MAREITYNKFKISLVVFMPNITTNYAITYTNAGYLVFLSPFPVAGHIATAFLIMI